MSEFDRTKPVYVYRNLNAGRGKKVYSVMQGGRVIKRVTAILLRDVEFVVRPGGYKRTRETGRKNVHAFAKGFVVGSVHGKTRFGKFPSQIVYSPTFGIDHFYAPGLGKNSTPKVLGAGAVILNKHGMTGIYLHTRQTFKGPTGGL